MKTTLTILAIVLTIVFTSYIHPESDSYVPISDANVKPDIASVMQFLKDQDYAHNKTWKLFPETDVSSDTLKRLGLPVHGRWVRTYVNSTAHQFLTQAVNADITQPLDFPPGSFIVKQNYRSKIDMDSTQIKDSIVLGVITLLYKPDPKFNYCATPHLARYDGSNCLGGEWFYGFFFAAEMEGKKLPPPLKKTSVAVNENVNSFCVNCHAPAFNTDYVRTLDNLRNPFKVASNTPYCDGFVKTKDTMKITTTPPKNLAKFKATVENYIKDASINPTLPGDVPKDPTMVFNYMGPKATQSMFDSYAWKSFIALNWPNKSVNPNNGRPQRGEANTQLKFQVNVDSSTVWETFKPAFEVFQPGAIQWNPVNQLWNQFPPKFEEPSCQTEEAQFVITMGSKTRDVANETGQAFAGSFGYLVDQDQNRVRYEVLFNRTEFEYLIGDGRAASLNLTPSGPKGLANKVHFPDNREDTLYKKGSMEIKSAWKELCLTSDCNQQDAKSLAAAKKRFLVRIALIYDEDTKTCRIAPMALVGLHIARKTHYAPQWIWMTFEHKDNVPDANATNKTGTFYNSKLAELKNCYQLPFLYPFKEVAACPNVDLNRFIDSLKMAPNQLTRLVPIDPVAQELNGAFQAELKKINSPFANYVLVNTQWALNGRQQDGSVSKLNCKDNGLSEDCFKMVPRYLRNSVIESYMATYCEIDGKPKQLSNRSCMGCHGTAGADLSYVYLDAVSQRILLADTISMK